MTCPHCEGAEAVFGEATAARDLRRYRRRGPSKTTRLLIGFLAQAPLDGRSLLEVGGGVGAVQHELAARGVSQITDVDASSAYLACAREEAERRGYAARATYRHGDFVPLAAEIGPHDVVVLDRVICCYPDWDALVAAAEARARHHLGIVLPRDRWWVRSLMWTMNLFLRASGNSFRTYVHPVARIEKTLRARGWRPQASRRRAFWHVLVFARDGVAISRP